MAMNSSSLQKQMESVHLKKNDRWKTSSEWKVNNILMYQYEKEKRKKKK